MTSVMSKINAPQSTELEQRVDTLQDDVGRLTDTVARRGKQKRAELVTVARQRTADAKRQATAQAETALGQATELKDDLDKFVRRNPLLSVGVAIGAGVLIATMMRRR